MTAFGRVVLGMALGVVAMVFGTVVLDRVTLSSIFGLRSRLPLIVPPGTWGLSGASSSPVAPFVAALGGAVREVGHLWAAYHVTRSRCSSWSYSGRSWAGWRSSSRWALSGLATWLGLLMVAVGLFGTRS